MRQFYGHRKDCHGNCPYCHQIVEEKAALKLEREKMEKERRVVIEWDNFDVFV